MLISVIHKDNGTFGSSVRDEAIWVGLVSFGLYMKDIFLLSAHASASQHNVYTTYPKINTSAYSSATNDIEEEVSCETTHSVLGATYVH